MWANGQTRGISAEAVSYEPGKNISVGSQVEWSFALPESFARGAKVFMHARGSWFVRKKGSMKSEIQLDLPQ
jgi:hypothetical protein